MKRLLKEPLIHFLVLGALLFAGDSVLNRRGVPKPGRIVISQGQLASMMENFTRTRHRSPTREEWEGLVRDCVREEVYCREAVALGLDKGDVIIRRRLKQKMEFVSDNIAAQSEPSDDELNAYLHAHADTFRAQTQFTFRHLYLNPEKHGTNLASDAAQLLAKLNQPGGDADYPAMGDPFMLNHEFTATPLDEVSRQLGQEFAASLDGIQPGRWRGPVKSGFGMHLVFISQRTERHLPLLDDVRDAVRREWESERRLEATGKFYQELLKRYTVTIEQPAADTRMAAETR